MTRLSHRELDALLRCIESCCVLCNLEAFPFQVMTAVQEMIPSDIISYNEVDLEAQTVRGIWLPGDAPLQDHIEALERYMHQHPLLPSITTSLAQGAVQALRMPTWPPTGSSRPPTCSRASTGRSTSPTR